MFSIDVIFKEFRAYLEEEPKVKTKTMHFETNQEDVHVEEQRNGLQDGEEEESSSDSSKEFVIIEEVDHNEEHEEDPLTPPLRMSTRQCNLVDRYSPLDFCCKFSLLSIGDEPRSYKEALSFEESESWMQEM